MRASQMLSEEKKRSNTASREAVVVAIRLGPGSGACPSRTRHTTGGQEQGRARRCRCCNCMSVAIPRSATQHPCGSHPCSSPQHTFPPPSTRTMSTKNESVLLFACGTGRSTTPSRLKIVVPDSRLKVHVTLFADDVFKKPVDSVGAWRSTLPCSKPIIQHRATHPSTTAARAC